ncbi:MAG: hypothetical protein EU549_00765 [Promethearchaeota archaeon]|nr:MAG: hypothetical protein EU549_00765 [Candidatus Lokiarchaeota archaeon]
MKRCENCGNELEIQIKEKNKIILVCTNPQCRYKSSEIVINDLLVSKDIEIHSKAPESNIIKDKISKATNNSYLSEEDSIDKVKQSENENVNFESYGSKKLFYRKGKIIGFDIFCLDFSSRMDIDIPHEKDYLDSYLNKIKEDKTLSESIKTELIDLITSPISYFRAAIFAISKLIIDNIKKMTVEDFHSLQILSLTGESDEIFRFPNFKDQTTLDIVKDFIKISELKRKEYNSMEILEFRDFSNALDNITELIIEVKEVFPDKNININFLVIGEHKTRDNQYFNPIRKIKYKMEDLQPFSINIINLNPTSSENIYRQIVNRYNGIYSLEFTLKGLLNAILNKKFGSDLNFEKFKIPGIDHIKNLKSIEVTKSPSKSKIPSKPKTPIITPKKPDNGSIPSSKYNFIKPKKPITSLDKIEEDDNFFKEYLEKEEEKKDWDKNIENIPIRRKSDGILESLIEKNNEG